MQGNLNACTKNMTHPHIQSMFFFCFDVLCVVLAYELLVDAAAFSVVVGSGVLVVLRRIDDDNPAVLKVIKGFVFALH